MYKTSTAEITPIYHTIEHSLSYNVAKSVECGRIKSEAIVCEVLAKGA